jgi:hypothetical protein
MEIELTNRLGIGRLCAAAQALAQDDTATQRLKS